MPSHRPRASVLPRLIILALLLSYCRAFHGPVLVRALARSHRICPSRSGRQGFEWAHAQPLVALPPSATGGLRSVSEKDGLGGGDEGGDGGSNGGPGMFGGLRQWWENEGKSDLMVYGTSLAIALTVRTVALEPRYIPSLSMFPTFEIGDQLAVDKLSAKLSRPYQRKDVVIFYPPPSFSEYSTRGTNEALIKRVIAVGGDTVEIKDGSLFINGKEQFEQYTFEEPEYKWGPQTVPEGMVMVLGDNRNHSLDSHIWGFLPRENVIGRAVFKYWPPWRAGLIES